MKLQLIRTLGFLVLLLSGISGSAFSFSENLQNGEKEEISYDVDVSEDSPEFSQSTLAGPQFNQSPRLLLSGGDNFYFRSTYISREANSYIIFSRLIDPSRDTAVIIFPFHSFL